MAERPAFGRKRMIIVSNRLPFTVRGESGDLRFKPSVGGLSTGLSSYLESDKNKSRNALDYIWVGWPGNIIEPAWRNEIKLKSLSKFKALPVFLSEENIDNYYHGFCNKTIWPLFHYFQVYTTYNEKYWKHYVRVNSLGSGMLPDDLEAVAVDGLEGIRIPKVDSPETVKKVDALLDEFEQANELPPGGIKLCIGLETARSVYLAYEILSASSRISSVALGLGRGGDLETDMGYLWSEERAEVLYVRSKVLLAARAAGIPIPMDGGYSTGRPYDRSRDEAGLIRDAQLGRSLGYRAKICFHPDHVEHINRIFAPTTKEIDYSRRVLEVFEAAVTWGSTSTIVDGKLIDDVQVANARRILSWAKSIVRE